MTLQMHTCNHPFHFSNGSGEHRSYSYAAGEEVYHHSGAFYGHKLVRGPPPRMSEPIRPHENDVLLGRGGKNNQHSGNEKLREIARGHSDNYRTSTKKGKSYISRQLVQAMRELQPPARFLKRNTQTGEWEDVGDDTAREKASQVLRDAVALLPDEQGLHQPERSEPPMDHHPYPPTVASVARVSTDEAERPSQHAMYSQPTGLQPILHSSLPPPTPVAAGSRKRRRYTSSSYYPYDSYSSEQLAASAPDPSRRRHSSAYHTTTSPMPQQQGQYIMPPPGAAAYPPPPGMSMPSPSMAQHYNPQYPQYSQHPYSQQQHPQYHHHRPPTHSQMGRPPIAARNSSTASAHSLLGDMQQGFTDFDLFNGELLESDHEDQRGGGSGSQEQRRQQPHTYSQQHPDAAARAASEYRSQQQQQQRQQYAAAVHHSGTTTAESRRDEQQEPRSQQQSSQQSHQYYHPDSQQSHGRDTI